jgi:hypothetical protein
LRHNAELLLSSTSNLAKSCGNPSGNLKSRPPNEAVTAPAVALHEVTLTTKGAEKNDKGDL